MKLNRFVQRLLGVPSDEERAKEDARQAGRQEHYDKTYDEIVALPLDMARQRAERLLSDPEKFECVVTLLVDSNNLSFLAPNLQALFSKYESIVVVDDEAFLSRSEIELLDWDGNGLPWGLPLWKIGGAHGHSMTMVTPYEEGVYDEMDGELGESLPSIYHWLLWVSAQASDFGL